jgi:hypothetical protein
MSKYDIENPRPWSGERWFIDVLFQEMQQDWPDTDKKYLFRGCEMKCVKAWKTMKKEQKKRFERYAEIDKAQCNTKPPAKKKAAKKLKDPNQPKMPLSGYMRFYTAKQKKIKDANPSFTIQDVAKEAARMWKEMSEKDKEQYNEKYKEEREIYIAKMAEYKNSLN